MDELKKLIDENRNLFDSAEPAPGHFDRFEKMLREQQNTKSRTLVWPTLLKVASIAILVVLSGLYLTEHFVLKKQPLAKTNTEFNEARQYYLQQVNQRIDQIESMEKALTPEQKQILIDEMTEMDNLYKKLQSDYKDMPNDPRIIQAMLQHYQMKVSVLNNIINNLDKVNQLNYTDYESVEL
ncbi:MAG: hypothetical protein AB7E36_17740 [Salinivirgaceae bacterium]